MIVFEEIKNDSYKGSQFKKKLMITNKWTMIVSTLYSREENLANRLGLLNDSRINSD